MQDSPRYRVLLAFVISLLVAAIALLGRWHLSVVLGERALYSSFLPAVMIAAYLGGFWPAFFITVLSAAVGNMVLVEPYFTLALKGSGDAVAISLFVVTSLFISALSESLHRAQKRLVSEERRRAEEALHMKEERFRRLVQNSSDIITFFDVYGTIIYQTPSIERVLGHRTESRIGKNVFRDPLVHPEDQAAKHAFFDAILRAQGTTVLAGFRLRHKDGTWRDMEAVGQNLLHEPSVAGIVANYRDITERKQAEKAMRESEERWRRLTETIPQFVWSASSDGTSGFFSAQFVRYTGIPESEMLGWRWLDVLHPDDREATRIAWTTSARTQSEYETEHRIRRADGVYRWFSSRGVPILDSSGFVFQWIGTSTDITTSKQHEEELRQANARLDLAVRGSNVAVWEVRLIDHLFRNGTVHLLNHWEQLGYDRPEGPVSATEWLQMLHADDQQRVEDTIQSFLDGATREYEAEFRIRHRDESYRWVLSRGVIVRDATGRPGRFTGIRVDITELKRAEEELRQAKEAAESANRAKDEFLANVSHEIRTPMNAILGLTELTLDTPLREDQRQCLRTVKSAANNLLGIINDLLDFSKIEAGKLELDLAELSLRPLVEDTLRALAVRAQAKNLELSCQFQDDVPEALLGDSGRLRQVLLNLVDNAIKFTERGKVAVEVAVETPVEPTAAAQECDDCVLKVTIRDTGIGIPREKQAKIFRAFEQEDSSTTRKYGGTGLGLTIAAQLVALMGGRISVDSEPGQGSTFSFTARLARLKQAASSMDAASADTSSRNERHRASLNILVAEDSEFNVQLIRELLVREGHRVTIVGDGQETLDLLATKASDFDLLLLDIHMPKLDGLQVIQVIRDRERITGGHLPVIALTARSRAEDRQRCLAAGMDEYLAKPVRAAELHAAIRGLVAVDPRKHLPSTTTLLDAQALLAACGGDAGILSGICRAFQASLPEQFAAIQRALQEQDARQLREAAHKLHGMTAAFSSTAGDLLSEIEDHASHGRTADCMPLAKKFAAAADLLVEEVKGVSIEALHARVSESENAQQRESTRIG